MDFARFCLKVSLLNSVWSCLKALEKHDQFWSCSFLPVSPVFASKWPQTCCFCFAFQKGKKVGRKTRPPPQIVFEWVRESLAGSWLLACYRLCCCITNVNIRSPTLNSPKSCRADKKNSSQGLNFWGTCLRQLYLCKCRAHLTRSVFRNLKKSHLAKAGLGGGESFGRNSRKSDNQILDSVSGVHLSRFAIDQGVFFCSKFSQCPPCR